MLNRIHFRNSLYKLILLQNIVENKVYKEKMTMLYSFEQMIINTEEIQEIQFTEQHKEEKESKK
jgi:hypothetical protein